MSQLRIAQLHCHYGAYRALGGIDLVVDDGMLLALLGPSGCGKSTMLQVVAGFQTPTSGEVWADDQLLSSARNVVAPEHRGISLVFQSYAVWPHKTVAQNVAFGLQIRRLPKAEVSQRLARVLRAVRLDHLADRYPSELSGGQQQRVALARALAIEPRVLLLDEPLSNLDANLREEMRFEIRRLHDALGTTTVYVTHDQSEALVIADRVAILNRGLLQQVGSPEEIFERPANDFVASFIGNSNTLPGMRIGNSRVRVGTMEFSGVEINEATLGETVALCIRPSKVQVTSGIDANCSPDCNILSGRVLRSAYMGEYRDVLMDVGDNFTLRAAVPSAIQVVPGEAVTVGLPVLECKIVVISNGEMT